jgi:16S rRNA (cytosine1402-N4)-methyltransferase
MASEHVPVLLEEVIHNLVSTEDCLFVDATVGGGGHTRAILERYPKVRAIGFDRDEEALNIAEARLSSFGDRVMLIRGNFRDLKGHLTSLGIHAVDSLLFDLGLSMYQVFGERGFSFNDDAFLDMRMDNRQTLTAYDVVNSYGYDALRRILEEYGEEYKAPRIARAIIDERRKRPITTGKELSAVVCRAKPKTGKIHPATTTFQAIRMEVNGELENLETGISDGIELLGKGGRIGMITFHSLEDRMVKYRFRAAPALKVLTKKPLRPDRAEIRLNPSSRSAKLRVGEKL